MRSLPAALTTAQRAKSRRPYFPVTVKNRFAGTRRLLPDTWYTGSEAPGPHGAVCGSDGSLIRVRIDGTTLYRQRVTSPSSGSTYSSWTSIRSNTRLCAVIAYGSVIVIVAVDSATPAQVYTDASNDNGVTWLGFSLAFTHSENIDAIGAAAKSDGNLLVVMNAGNNLAARRWTGAAWTAAVVSTDGLLTPTGIAVHHHGDWIVVTTGTPVAEGGSRITERLFGDGYLQTANTWGSATTIQDTHAGSLVTFSAPFLARPDTTRLTFREAYAGTGAYDRIAHSHTPATADNGYGLWREPIPFDLDHDYGLALAVNPAHIFLTTPARVYALALTAVPDLDVTADVIAVDWPDSELSAAPVLITLNNQGGEYDGPHPALTRGAQVELAPGYKTASGDLAGTGPALWLASVELNHDTNPPTCVLDCRGIGYWLERTRSAHAISFSARSPFNILRHLIARAGFELSSSGASTEASTLTPTLTVPPGESILSAVYRVLQRIPDTIVCRAHFAFLNEPLAADTAAETYDWQTGNHPIAGARYKSGTKPSAHVRVIGGPTFNVIGEAIDFTLAAQAPGSPRVITDRELTTAASAGDRAEAQVRRYEIENRADIIRAPVHCGIEYNDVIAVNDARAGLSSAKRRVKKLRTVLDRRRGIYEQTIELGAA